MAIKTYSIFKAAQDLGGLSNQKLVIELHKNHFSCLVVDETNEIIAFEFFEFENNEFDIEIVLSEVMIDSRILDKSFANSELYFNTPEAVLIPQKHNTDSEVDDFLNLACGSSLTSENKIDKPYPNSEIEVAYRIPNQFIQHINSRLIGVQYHHTYSKIIQELLNSKKEITDYYIKLQVYKNHFILAALKNKELQIIQSFNYKSTYDILYYLFNTCTQFEIPVEELHIELNGFVDLTGSFYVELVKYCRNISVQELDNDISSDFKQFPKHYFTAFVNLAL
jgi:hypothetical protein